MGVLGLWRLLDATGKPVPLETLEGKVLAIDVSIWIHQVIQGYQDRRGNMLPNAHLIGLFNRICKLLYFKIKPVFVFDGGVPLLKKNTIATRRKLKSIAASKAQKLKNDLINNLIKHTAVTGVLEKGNDEGESSTTQKIKDPTGILESRVQDMYKLPEIPSTSKFVNSEDYINSDDEQLETSPRKQTKWMGNIHSVNLDTEEFKNLPADVRYDILTDLKETRKQNSWGRIHELPKDSNNYSGFQVGRLLKRRYVQESLEVAEKEMGGKTLTLEELDKLLTDQGINTTQHRDAAFRIASDSTTRVIYLKDKPTQNNENLNDSKSSSQSTTGEKDNNTNDEIIDSMSINSDSSIAVIDDIQAYDLDEDWNSDESFADSILNDSHLLPKSNIPKSVMNPALAYMLEHSGLKKEQILKIVEQSKQNKKSESGSSQGSSKRAKRTGSRLSLLNRKRKRLFESTIAESPKIKREKIIRDLPINEIESNSESDDFIEVSGKFDSKVENIHEKDTKKAITVQSSDSDSDDFIEIPDEPIPDFINIKKPKNEGFQITIKADEELKDDIFADVFVDMKNVIKENEILEEKSVPIRNEILNKNIDEAVFNEIVEKVMIKVKEEMEKSVHANVDNIEFSLPTSCENIQEEKLNSSTEDINTSSTSETSLITVINNELRTENETKEDSSEIVDSGIFEKSSESLVVHDAATSSENLSKNNLMEELNVIHTQDESNEKFVDKVEEIEKESPLVLPTDEKELEAMKEKLEIEQQQINVDLGKLTRQATDITDQMRLEAQELLRLFGIPYLVAPMEAEAQCAYLEQIKLTDGTITDDSDIWLFGGHCVYKNFFDNNKRVLQFLSNDIEHHFKLSRKALIQLAMLVGSDYTNGLAGVGPVTALEILASFPCEGEDTLRGLRTFCSWLRAGKLTAPGKITLRNKLKNVQIEKGFPSQAVVQAYLSPTIDESKEAFSWGKPNLVLLADYAKKKFGWTKLKFDEIMNPVMKKLTEAKSQKGIDSYFKVHTIPKSIEAALSKRVQTAVQKLGGQSREAAPSDDEVPSMPSQEKPKRARKTIGKRGKTSKDELSQLSAITETNEAKSKTGTREEQEETKTEQAIETLENDSINVKRRKFVTVDEEVIPQREKDKVNALKTKLKAIEIFRKSKKGPGRVKKSKKVVKKIKDEADLSESSNSD